jgi:hypothetical protein
VYDPAEQAILLSEKLYTPNWLSYISDAMSGSQEISLPPSTPMLTHKLLEIERVGAGFLLKAGKRP